MDESPVNRHPPDLSRLRIERDRPAKGLNRAFRLAGYAGAGVVVAALAVWFVGRSKGATEVQVALAEVRGGRAGGRTGVSANGYVVARTKASVASKITGRLEFLGVTEGSQVRKGEVIARLENRDYAAALAQREAELTTARAALAEARAQRDQAQRDLERARELLAQGLVAIQEVERLSAQFDAADARVRLQEAQVRAAQAAVEAARVSLENTYIRAPFDGTISARMRRWARSWPRRPRGVASRGARSSPWPISGASSTTRASSRRWGRRSGSSQRAPIPRPRAPGASSSRRPQCATRVDTPSSGRCAAEDLSAGR
ncbi:MAG: biotin/lipoyl-binding protein [Gemmatimonadetes bacterium]|nr:biotin/lipoyl-binding protein [Gemmatimonadota bacterium]